MDGGNYCKSCGVKFESAGRFCRGCGAPRPGTADARPDDAVTESRERPQPDSAEPTPRARRAQPEQPPHDHSEQPSYSSTANPPPVHGYSAPPSYASPGLPSGYPAPANFIPVPIEHRQAGGIGTGWLIGGIAAAILVIAGIGVGIYFAASGHSGGQTRLLATPVITTAASAAASSPEPVSHSQHARASSSATPPSHPTVITHTVTAPAVAHSAIAESSERRAVADTIERHFSLISQHDFSAAYALLAPSLQSGESSWVAAHKEDGIYKVEVSVNATLNSPDSATAAIAKMTTLDGHGCKNWSGSWGLTKIGHQWRISEANVTPTPC
jgi:hypothetical protein